MNELIVSKENQVGSVRTERGTQKYYHSRAPKKEKSYLISLFLCLMDSSSFGFFEGFGSSTVGGGGVSFTSFDAQLTSVIAKIAMTRVSIIFFIFGSYC